MTELAFGSDKTRDLFKEVIDIASDECGFDAEGSQLMIEAIPVSLEAVVIMVTKMSEKEKINFDKDKNDKKRKKRRPIFNKTSEEGMFIYEFHSLDDVSLVARTLYGRFNGDSSLIKKERKYFLVLKNKGGVDDVTDSDLEIIIGEYGKRHVVTPISRVFLFEHGEVIIAEHAIEILGEYL